ncbi:MAG: DUF2333 family protein [Deltaproteobacteria bacterium]|nr:DUF2333 family protein [Deltaproteobacteria bacterium]
MGTSTTDKGFHKFFWPRIIAGILITIGLIWGLIFTMNFFKPVPGGRHTAAVNQTANQKAVESGAEKEKTGMANHATPEAKKTIFTDPPGVMFVDSLIAPLEYELTKRFWGWRPNDIINFTDNVNEIQLGVLEATRRATVALTERLSRTGSTAPLDNDLERAMNDLMIKADSYWFPTPESKYREAIAEMRKYQTKVRRHETGFYTRADNLIPLLKSFQELLGSCDDSLAKQKEKDGTVVSTFDADNYVYYAKGVAITIESVLKGVEHDFKKTLKTRNALNIIHHAIEDCHVAAEINPWFVVTEGNLSGIFANHRANMAAPISHTQFYINLLIKALST